jgi:methylmalonyl-CoA mutase N-terminal domain/subunit
VQEIEGMGDPAELSDSGWFKRNIFDHAMQRYAKKLQDMELMKVGVNIVQMPAEEDTLLKEVAETKIEPCFDRIAWVKSYKSNRDQAALEEVMRELFDKAGVEEENLMHPVIRAMEKGATMEEIAGVLRMAYKEDYDPFGKVECPFSL